MIASNKKILVAMSGGVDSSVAAALLKAQNNDVSGATMKLFGNENLIADERNRTCCSINDIADAREAAYRLEMPHYVFNFSRAFSDHVTDKFVSAYLNGQTPNPCIDCNRYIKFGQFLDRALLLGFDMIATGHYAVTQYDASSNRFLLKKAADKKKDQTYALYCMTQKQLQKTLFPLGGLTKSEARDIAESFGLTNAGKPESQDICFVKNGDYSDFIEHCTGSRAEKGCFTDTGGNILGFHEGLIHYTIGQHKGLGSGFGKRLYVLDKDTRSNTVMLGEDERLYKNRIIAADINLIAVDELLSPCRVQAKIRYGQSEENAVVHPLGEGEVLIEFENPQRAPAPGQAVVFYDGDIVIGGGTIKT